MFVFVQSLSKTITHILVLLHIYTCSKGFRLCLYITICRMFSEKNANYINIICTNFELEFQTLSIIDCSYSGFRKESSIFQYQKHQICVVLTQKYIMDFDPILLLSRPSKNGLDCNLFSDSISQFSWENTGSWQYCIICKMLKHLRYFYSDSVQYFYQYCLQKSVLFLKLQQIHGKFTTIDAL